MNGRVDPGRRALVAVKLKSAALGVVKEIEAWVDTGFTGDLVLPDLVIQELGLSQSGTVDSQLGDGATAVMDMYTCTIDWFGNERPVEVISSKVRIPLLGAGLLQAHRLIVDYSAKTVAVE